MYQIHVDMHTDSLIPIFAFAGTMGEKAIMIRELSDKSRKWKAKLRVIQKQPPRTSKLGTTTIQQFILADSEILLLLQPMFCRQEQSQSESMDNQLKQIGNPEKIEEIANSKHMFLLPSPTSSSETFEVVPINNLSSHEGTIWIKGKITAEPITQRPWYVACNKCNCSTMEDIGTSFTCIECNTEQSTVTARSILRVQIKDNSGSFQTAIFGPHAEKWVGHSANALVQLNLRERMQKIADMNMASKEKEYYIHLAPTKNASSTWSNNKWTTSRRCINSLV
ncbi:hypothetical protein ACSBR1_014431 [Camellia fascicularis]